MPLSNYLPSSRLIQPGVCTSSTRPASPFNGQVIYETDTRQTLVWNGSGWIMLTDADAPPGLQLIKSQNIVNTGIFAIDVTNAFSADFDNYRIEIVTDASGDGAFMYLTLGTVATGYFGSIYFDNYNGGSTGIARRNNSTLCEIGVGGQNDNTAIAFDIQSPNLAKATNWHGTYFGGGWSGWFGGYQNSATQFTGFTLSIQAGTFSNGTIRVYGYRN